MARRWRVCASDFDCSGGATCTENYAGVADQNLACLRALSPPGQGSIWAGYELISSQWTTENGQTTNTPEQRCQNTQAFLSPTPTGPINWDEIRERVTLANGSNRPILGNTSMETYDRASCLTCHARTYLNGVCSNDTSKVCSDKNDCGGNACTQYSTDTMYFLKLEVAQPPALRFDDSSLEFHPSRPGRKDDRFRVRFQSNNIVAGLVGSKDDPRCHELPSGSVKAQIRFHRDGQGLEGGVIDLPCQRWKMQGNSGNGPTYRYEDLAADHGPCTSVTIGDGRAISAHCAGELIPEGLVGTPEDSPLQVMLVTGNRRYCAELEHAGDASGGTGSNGKKTLESVLLPTVCPDL